ncbi:hypothetical protein [Actinoplanes sp. GCM10030250]|uniref:hypothetical protein n=1 Tax=Actinoplanes sp. GCM10030250 TaxID=3273376 RepID=UPI003617B432
MEEPAVQDLWSTLLTTPAQAPETLALAAVQTLGPRAKTWAAQTRGRYPRATPDALARLAIHRFTRSAALRSALTANTGLYTPVTLLAAAALTQSELVLHLAAAYGIDPTDRNRADDLLRLAPLDPRRLAGAGVTWAALRLTNRVFPGTSLVAAVLTARSSTEALAIRASRHYRESQLSQESGSS